MISDQDIRKIFEAHKSDFPDNGFSEQLINRLPPRTSPLPQMVMILCVIVGLGLTVGIVGINTIFDRLIDLVTAVGNLKIPSALSVATYFGVMSVFGLIGYTMVRTSSE